MLREKSVFLSWYNGSASFSLYIQGVWRLQWVVLCIHCTGSIHHYWIWIFCRGGTVQPTSLFRAVRSSAISRI